MSGINKDKITFDESDSSGDSLGAFLRSSDGTLLTHTTVGGKESLDVNVTQSSGQYAEDAVHTDGDIGNFMLAVRSDAEAPLAGDGDYHPLLINSEGRLKTDAELASDVADDEAATENPIPVSGVGQGAALTALSASGDKGNLTMDLYRRVFTNNSAAIGVQVSQATVTDTAAEVLAVPLAGRKEVIIQNAGTRDVAIGHSAAVTYANGLVIPRGNSVTLEVTDVIDLFMISETGSQDVRFFEMA